jgi:hypothetical protein
MREVRICDWTEAPRGDGKIERKEKLGYRSGAMHL